MVHIKKEILKKKKEEGALVEGVYEALIRVTLS